MGGIDALSVVAVQPEGKRVVAGLVVGEGLAVGPFGGQSLFDTLYFAIKSRAAWSDELPLGPEPGDGVFERDGAAVGEGVVADHPFGLGDALSREVGSCAGQEPGGGGPFLVRLELCAGQAGVVADDCVDVLKANEEPLALVLGSGIAAQCAPAAAVGGWVRASSRRCGSGRLGDCARSGPGRPGVADQCSGDRASQAIGGAWRRTKTREIVRAGTPVRAASLGEPTRC